MIDLGAGFLMMIEPQGNCEPAIDDKLTKSAEFLFSRAENATQYRGFHHCKCGALSDNVKWTLVNGIETNSLLAHYVRHHRSEIPESELEKLRDIVNWYVPPIEALSATT